MSEWILKHDDRWLFTILYVSLAVILSIAISIFWLVALVAVHAGLEWYALKHHAPHQTPGTRLKAVIWHLKLDFMLIIFALWLGVYIDVIFGLLGLGAAARAGAQVSSRVLAWQRATRGILLTLDDVAQVAKAVKTNQVEEEESLEPWRQPWGVGAHLTIWSSALFVLLIALAPLITEQSASQVIHALAMDLHPWP